jgi:GntR family transcriptional regulator
MFQINLRSQQSIYEQIIDNIKELIIRGVLPEDSELPSIRELSRTLTVNPTTVQKAFKELEREGFIYKVKGRGTFVSPRRDSAIDPQAVQKVCADIRNSVQELSYMGVPKEEIQKMVSDIAADPFDEDKKEGYL